MNQQIVIAAMAAGAVGCLILMIGTATIEWVFNNESGFTAGLFMFCRPKDCDFYAPEGSVLATRVIMIITILFSVVGLTFSILYFVNHIRKDVPNIRLPVTTCVIYFITLGMAILGVFIFAAAAKGEMETDVKRDLSLGYSFGLAIVGGLINGAAGGCMLVHRLGLNPS